MKEKQSFYTTLANQLISIGKSTSDLGLWNGKTGIAISLLHLHRIMQDKTLEVYANELIDDVVENISAELPFHFSDGLLGIGCGIQYIINEQFIEGDSDEILSDIDQIAINSINYRGVNSLSLENGVCGIGFYLYHRLKDRSTENDTIIALKLKEHLIYLIDWMEELLLKTELAQEYNDTYFLLCRLYSLPIFNFKVEKLLESCLNKINTDESIVINDNYRYLGIKSLQLLDKFIHKQIVIPKKNNKVFSISVENNEPIVVVRLMGGLGNQMYQYAASKALAERTKAKLIIDAGFYEYTFVGVTPREYELSAFELEAPVFNSEKSLQLPSGLFFLKEKCWHKYDERITEIAPPCCLTGYWQSERYFKEIEDSLRIDFRFKDNVISQNAKELGVELSETSSSVSIHIRRTDYAVHPNYFLPLHYYQKAVDYFCEKLREPLFYVFSDDPDWVEQHFQIPASFRIVRGYSGTEDMYLMSQCRHNIIANSSFSWWAAWLNANKDKIVVAPRKFNFDASLDTDDMDLMPPEWVCLW